MKIEPEYLRELAENIGGLRFGKRFGYETPIPMAFINAASEIELLRIVIEKAPHGNGCSTGPCTCWKADML
jgi:hypothetical protein